MTTILIVDDAEFLRMRISRLLAGQGYNVLQAEDGRSAVKTYKASLPDVVLLDITMPEMDGLTALKEIIAVNPCARVVMLTALGQQSVLLEAVRAGARDFVVKPFEAERVLTAITNALGCSSKV